MSAKPVICNSSPIIALDRIGRLDLLRDLHEQILVPPAVAREVSARTPFPSWIVEIRLGQPIGSRILSASLGTGESEAIALALETDPRFVLLDDWEARRLATLLGLPVAETLAVLIHAKSRGIVPAVRPLLESLVAAGFRMSPSIMEDCLKKTGEEILKT